MIPVPITCTLITDSERTGRVACRYALRLPVLLTSEIFLFFFFLDEMVKPL